ncbi:siderophore-interacting protein [Halioxenophilus aromaticivorans]|uniref:Siderophore-interacting protein n=1 Tax=Halioxenophilus aromaticivorans TaxID=1306992 RepID=A0AAV3U750_9ALTE
MTTYTPVTDDGTELVRRVRHELRLRNLTVCQRIALTPSMIRLVLTGDDLHGFTSASPDDHIKLFLVDEAGEALGKRDYTPRHYDAERNELTIDFVVHDAGPATQWAKQAQVGDSLQIGGPRGSQVVSDAVQRWLLIGDESALPAIARRLEELAPSAQATSLVVVSSAAEKQRLARDCRWIVRQSAGSEADQIQRELADIQLTEDTFIWLAGESGMVKQLRRYLLDERQHNKKWFKASGYWKQGSAETSEKFD